MILTAKLKEALPTLLPVLLRLPDGTPVEPHFCNADLAIQCYSQNAVKAIRACFPGVVWQKNYSGKWEYRTTWNGITLFLYACEEAPQTCRAIEKKVTVKRSVPVAFEEREVEETVIEWQCAAEEADHAA